MEANDFYQISLISLYIDKDGRCVEMRPQLGELEKTLFSMCAPEVEIYGLTYEKFKDYAFLGDIKIPLRHVIYRFSYHRNR